MKFYDCATAPSPRRVRIFAAEKGIQLADNAFIAGENFTIADITAMVIVDFVDWIKIRI